MNHDIYYYIIFIIIIFSLNLTFQLKMSSLVICQIFLLLTYIIICALPLLIFPLFLRTAKASFSRFCILGISSPIFFPMWVFCLYLYSAPLFKNVQFLSNIYILCLSNLLHPATNSKNLISELSRLCVVYSFATMYACSQIHKI